MAEINYAGEYDLKELRILTSSGVVMDATNLVQSIEMFENLESPEIKEGDILFFPDNLIHFVPKNKTNKPRLTIAFTVTKIN